MQAPNFAQRGDRLLKIGAVWHVLGCGPLYFVILRSKMGIGDPDPNPVLFGMMAGVSFLPSLVVMAIGLFQKLKGKSA